MRHSIYNITRSEYSFFDGQIVLETLWGWIAKQFLEMFYRRSYSLIFFTSEEEKLKFDELNQLKVAIENENGKIRV